MTNFMDACIGKSLVSRKQNKVYIPKKVMDMLKVKDGEYLGFFKIGEDIVIRKMELVIAEE